MGGSVSCSLSLQTLTLLLHSLFLPVWIGGSGQEVGLETTSVYYILYIYGIYNAVTTMMGSPSIRKLRSKHDVALDGTSGIAFGLERCNAVVALSCSDCQYLGTTFRYLRGKQVDSPIGSHPSRGDIICHQDMWCISKSPARSTKCTKLVESSCFVGHPIWARLGHPSNWMWKRNAESLTLLTNLL